ncbi:MAG: ATP-grasp domain-containing protein [Pseudomonadota bacterium]
MKPARKLVLLAGSGIEPYRRYLLEQASEEYDIWLVDDALPTWQRRFIVGFTPVENFESRSLERAALEVGRSRRIDGLVCWDDRHVIAAADAATLLGLRALGAIGARGCRDKSFSRERLRAAGVLQPDSRYCLDENEAIQAAEAVGYPVIVKPRGMGGSIGVARADDKDQLVLRFREADAASMAGADEFKRGAIVEQYVDGPEVSIDGRIVDGKYEQLFIARKTVGLPPHFEETGHVVDSEDPLLQDCSLLATLIAAHDAIEIQNGITHTEAKLTRSGWVIIEINGRLGGDLIPYLATLATGLQAGRIAAQIACGDLVDDQQRTTNKAAAISFSYPQRAIVVDAVHLPPAEKTGSLTSRPVALAKPGDRLGLPPEAHLARVGYAIATGPGAEPCARLSRIMADRILATPRQHLGD